MSISAPRRLEEFEDRLKKLEDHGFEDTVTLVEILSSLSFFGALKMKSCAYAKDGQCGLYVLSSDAKMRIPVASDCRIRGCVNNQKHLHLELSNVTCAFCPGREYGKSPVSISL